MRRRLVLMSALVGIFSVSAEAQTQVGTKPAVGESAVAPIGGEMLTEFKFRGRPGVILKGDVRANWGSLENVDLPSGTALAIIREKKTKACQSRTNIGWFNCVIDTDQDGAFDRVSFNDIAGAKDIVPPVPYTKEIIALGVDPRFGEGNDFKRVYVFAGVSSGSLSISYREFVNDWARPAFTEQLSIPLGATFPQTIAVRDRVFKLEGVDGMGLRYTVVK